MPSLAARVRPAPGLLAMHGHWFHGLRPRLLLPLLFLALVGLGAQIAISAFYFRQHTSSLVERRAATALGAFDAVLQERIEGNEVHTRLLAGTGTLGRAVAERNAAETAILIEAALDPPGLSFALVFDREGRLLAATGSFAGDPPVRLAETIADRTTTSDVRAVAGGLQVTALAPIVFRSTPVGVVAAGFVVDESALASIREHLGVELAVFASDGLVATSVVRPEVRAALDQGQAASAVDGFGRFDLGVSSRAVGPDGAVVALVSTSDLSEARRDMRILTLGVAAVLLVVLVVFVVLVSRRIVGPLERLGDAATAVRRGNYSVVVPPASIREMDEVGAAFNHMTAELARQVEVLTAEGRRLQSILDSSPDLFSIIAFDGTVLFANASHRTILGYEPGELDFAKLNETVHPDDRPPVPFGSSFAALGERNPEPQTLRIRDVRGEYHAFEVVVTPIPASGGQQPALVVASREVTARQAAEARLRDSEARKSAILASAPDGIFALDAEGTITEAYSAVHETFGLQAAELTGRRLWDLFEPPVAHPDLDELARQAVAPEFVAVHRDGSRRPVELRVARVPQSDPSAYIAAARDLTDRRRVEAQLLQAQKMEGIGRLAGGIAHDFNNLLTAIVGYSEILASSMSADDPRRGDLQEIQGAASRAGELTRQLLAFARKQVVQPRVLDVDEVVGNMGRLLRRLIGEDISLVLLPANTPAYVNIDPGQLEQVIINLAVNARDAMPAGGSLTLATALVTLAEGRDRSGSLVMPGNYVQMVMTDTGSGMSPETMGHIFEPFFTTKDPGKGTGLGLATCFGIVQQAGGHIIVASKPGEGTTISIFLPLATAPAVHDNGVAPLANGAGRERVLLVEDEPILRNLMLRTLRESGYDVQTAASGVEALDLLDRPGHATDILVTDVVMPRMSGVELSRAVARRWPQTAVLYISGYSDELTANGDTLPAGGTFLQKPFTGTELARKVREVLSAQES